MQETNQSSINSAFDASNNFCSDALAARIEKSLRPHVDKYKRAGLTLTRVVENVSNCGVLKTRQQAELAAAFGVQPKLHARLK